MTGLRFPTPDSTISQRTDFSPMPRDRHVNRALQLQRDPTLPPTLALDPGLCPILRPDHAMKERLGRHEPPLPRCPGGACPVLAFFAAARADGAPVELDVGSGYGRFARAHAAAHPNLRLLALEQDEARVARCDVASRREGIRNVAWLACEARHALEYCVPAGAVSAAYVLFPDPWPKDRHAHNRIFRRENIGLFWRVLSPGGVLNASTDNPDYFGQMLEAMADDERFERTAPAPRPPEERTDFECKFLGQGKTVYSASWRRR